MPTILELVGDDGTVTRWTCPELTVADVSEVIRQHAEELVDCPDCDGGYRSCLPYMDPETRRSLRVKCARCSGEGRLTRADLEATE